MSDSPQIWDILERPAPEATVRLPYGSDPSQFGDLWLPVGATYPPIAVVVHGGYWRARYGLEHIGHLCRALAARGVAVWSLEYRRLGQDGGGWPGTFLDVGTAIDHLRVLAENYHLDQNRVISVGHSAGGHLALWLAGRHRISTDSPLYHANPFPLQGAVSLAGVIDLQMAWDLQLSNGVVAELLGGSPAQLPERYAAASPTQLVPLGLPQLLIHGTADGPEHYDLSVRYRTAALAAGDSVSMAMLEGANHFDLIDPTSSVWPEVERAILSLV